MVIVLSTTFNTISVISWRSVVLVEETGETTDKLYHMILFRVQLDMDGVRTHNVNYDRH